MSIWSIWGRADQDIGEVVVKPLRESREQIRVKLERLGDAVAEFLFQQDSQAIEPK